MGKVIRVRGIQAKLMAAIESGIRTVVLPKDNEQEVSQITVEKATVIL